MIPARLHGKTLVIAGPTSSGKSGLALALAERIGGEIIGCDSVQIYKGFDVGSAKPTRDEMQRVPHHLVDLLDWDEDYDAALYAQAARGAISAVHARGKLPIVVGGTGLYLRALLGSQFDLQLPKDEALRARLRAISADELYAQLRELDPRRAEQLHPNDRFRVVRALELAILSGRPLHEHAAAEPQKSALDAYVVVLDPPRAELHARIAARTTQMLQAGLVAEVESLLARGVAENCKPMQSIGYKQCAAFLRGALPDGKTLSQAIVEATRQYAKRQSTWFKKTPADARLDDPMQGLSLLGT